MSDFTSILGYGWIGLTSRYSHHASPRSQPQTRSRSRTASSSVSPKRKSRPSTPKSRPQTPIFPRLGSTARDAESCVPPLPTEGDLSRLYQAIPLASPPTSTSRHVGQSRAEVAQPSAVTAKRRLTPYYQNASQRANLESDSCSQSSTASDSEEDVSSPIKPSIRYEKTGYLPEISTETAFDHIRTTFPGPSTNTAPLIPNRPKTQSQTPASTSETSCIAKSVRSISTSLRPRPSKSKLQLPQPVSSSTPAPIPRILSALTARDVTQRRLTTTADASVAKQRKITDWRSEVEENGDLARLEERIVKHLEREKETIRDMGRREGCSNGGCNGSRF